MNNESKKKPKQSKLTDIFKTKDVLNALPPTVGKATSKDQKEKSTAVPNTINKRSSKRNVTPVEPASNQNKSLRPGVNSSRSSSKTSTSKTSTSNDPTAEDAHESVTNVSQPAAAQIDSRVPGTNLSHSSATNEPVIQQIVSREPDTNSAVNRITSSRDITVVPPLDISPIGSSHPKVTITTLKDVKFPKNDGSRSFQLHWMEKWTWIEYSVEKNAVFCFACRCFDLNLTKETTFTCNGFDDWKHATGTKTGFTKHENSTSHIQSMRSWRELVNREKNQSSVVEILTNTTLEKRRYYMKNVIDVIIFLIKNELAFRGNWDEEHHKEDGLVRNLFEFKLKDNEYLRKCQSVMPRNATYMSPDIQNELIAIIAKIIQQKIIDDINSADVPYFTLLSDGTKDRNMKEFISIVIRYVKNARPIESLLGFETTDKFDAQTQADLLIKTLKRCSLHLGQMLSQCYDGANVMSGDEGGIQRIVQRALGRVIPYVHCFNHKLHLVLIAALESDDIVRLFFDTLKVLYAFFHRSKVRTVYNGSAICNLIVTRWAGHHRSTTVVYNNYDEIKEALNKVITDTKTIEKKEFVFTLVFMHQFLNIIAPADKILQSRDIGFREAVPVIETVKSEVLKLRSTESFHKFWASATDLEPKASPESVATSRPRRIITRPSSFTEFIITDRIGERNSNREIEISSSYFKVLDLFLSELKKRFEENADILESISRIEEFDLSLLTPLKDLGIKMPTNEELAVAKSYIDLRRKNYELSAQDDNDKKSFKNRFRVLSELYNVRDAFPNVYELFATVDTFACSTATPECSFSALERLGCKSRQSMTTNRLRDLTFLAFESKRLDALNIDEVLKTFNDNPKRRVQLY